MLDTLRQRSNSFIILFLFAIIIIVFAINFGPGSGGCQSQFNYVASVNGQWVTPGELSYMQNALYRSYQAQNPQFNDEMARGMKLQEKALDYIVTRIILADQARAMGVDISREELRRDILDDPSFHEGGGQGGEGRGAFSPDLYKRMVAYYFRTTPKKYEEQRRQQIMGRRVADLVEDSIMLTDDEAYEEYQRQATRVNLQFIAFGPGQVPAGMAEPTPQEVSAWQGGHAAEIEAYYKTHIGLYDVPEKVRLARILLPLDGQRPAKVRQKAKEIVERAGTEDFAGLAKEFSSDPFKDQGGMMGLVSRAELEQPLAEAAFAAEAGSVVGPVETAAGMHVLKVLEKLPAAKVTLEQAAADIAGTLLTEEKRRAALETMAGEAHAKALAGATLEEIAGVMAAFPADGQSPALAEPSGDGAAVPALEVRETGPFGRNDSDYVYQIGASAPLMKEAFALTAEKPVAATVFEVDGSFYVVRLKEREDATWDEYQKVKDRFKERAAYRDRARLVSAWIKHLRDKADVKVRARLDWEAEE